MTIQFLNVSVLGAQNCVSFARGNPKRFLEKCKAGKLDRQKVFDYSLLENWKAGKLESWKTEKLESWKAGNEIYARFLEHAVRESWKRCRFPNPNC